MINADLHLRTYLLHSLFQKLLLPMMKMKIRLNTRNQQLRQLKFAQPSYHPPGAHSNAPLQGRKRTLADCAALRPNFIWLYCILYASERVIAGFWLHCTCTSVLCYKLFTLVKYVYLCIKRFVSEYKDIQCREKVCEPQ